MGILGLSIDYTSIYPEITDMEYHSNISLYELPNKILNRSRSIFDELLKTTDFTDPHYYFTVGYSISNTAIEYGVSVASQEYIKLYINGWLKHEKDNIHYISSCVLSRLLHPYITINLLNDFPNIRESIEVRYHKEQETDKLIAIYLGIIIGIEWNLDELKVFFKKSKRDHSLYLFTEKLGLKYCSEIKEYVPNS